MRVSDERYNGLIKFYKQLAEDCNQVETLQEFCDKFADKYDIEDSNLEEGLLTVEDCGDLYTINGGDWGLEVSQDVEIQNDEWRCPMDVYLETSDIYE